MKGLVADVRHALRVYARTPVASGLAVVVLAVAMAFVASFLSLYIDIVYQPNPGFEDSGELVTIGQNNGQRISSMSQALIDRIDEEVGSLSATSGFMLTNLEVGPERERRNVELLGGSFFDGLRARLELGRGFDEQDHATDAEPVAVISYRYWQEAYGASPDAVGRIVEIRGRPQFNLRLPGQESSEPQQDQTTEFRIVGVMSEALASLQGQETAVWIPYETGMPLYFGPWETVRSFQMLRVLGRLTPGAEPAAVAAELNERYGELDEQGINPDEPFDAMGGLVLDINAQRNATQQLQLFLAGSVLLAFVAAANVSLFLLSRAPGRRRELGIRMSVGAPLRRLGRQLATEAALLIVAATGLGLLAGFWLQSYLQSLSFLEGARWQSVSLLDWRVLVLIVSFLLLLTTLVSLAPVLGLKRLGIATSSRSVAMRANLTQRTACTAQIAIAGVVAAAAISFGWYLGLLLTADHGYDVGGVHAVTMTQQPTAGPGGGQDFAGRFAERERRREIIAAIPGVDGVAFGTAAPGVSMGTLTARIPRPVPPEGTVQFGALAADPQYFEMLDIDLLDGSFYEGDEGDVMIVNEAAARLIWGRVDVVGETLPISVSGAESSAMIGVVADVPHEHPEVEVPPRVYLPIMPFFGGEVVFVESAMSTADLRTRLQSLIDSGELDFTIQNVQRLSERMTSYIAADRARGVLTIVSAVIVLVVAGFGFYGTQRFLVAAGRREYAIRASVGAGPTALGRLVMSRGLVLSLPGVVLGGLLAFIVSAWLRDDFVSREISPGVVTMAVVAALAGLLLAASLGPARQARRTEPAPLLREE